MMEPTANELHAGCLGNINATWTFHGRSGHSARPWLADNAIERAAAGVLALAAQPAGPARVRRARVRRGRERHADRGRDRDERDPRPRGVPRQLPLRARPLARRRPRRGSPSCARATASCGSTPTRRPAPSRPARASTRSSPPATSRARPSRPGRRSRSSARPGSPRSTSARASPPRRTGATSRSRSPRSCAPTRCWSGSRHEARPGAHRPGTYPFVRLAEEKRRLLAAGVDLIDFGMGEPREETPAFIREALAEARRAALHLPGGRGPARAARGGRRLGRAPLRHGARPADAGPAHARLQGGDLPPRAGARREPRRRAVARLPGLRARRRLRGQRGASSCRSRGARLPARPRRGAARRPGARRRSCGSTTRTTRPAATAPLALLRARRRARPRARLRRRLRRGLLGALLRRHAARLGAAARRPAATSRSSTRSPSAPRCPATARASSPATRS